MYNTHIEIQSNTNMHIEIHATQDEYTRLLNIITTNINICSTVLLYQDIINASRDIFTGYLMIGMNIGTMHL